MDASSPFQGTGCSDTENTRDDRVLLPVLSSPPMWLALG